jgi:hypothetical protein
MKTYKVATKLQASPVDEGSAEYHIDIQVEEECVPAGPNTIESVKRLFSFPELNIPPGSYFAKAEIDGELYAWDIRAGSDPLAPTRLQIHETRP